MRGELKPPMLLWQGMQKSIFPLLLYYMEVNTSVIWFGGWRIYLDLGAVYMRKSHVWGSYLATSRHMTRCCKISLILLPVSIYMALVKTFCVELVIHLLVSRQISSNSHELNFKLNKRSLWLNRSLLLLTTIYQELLLH